MEYRTWTQGVTFCTRMDYLTPMFQETAFCLGVEKLLGVTDQIPERATVIRVLMMELTRISSHLVALATGGMEMGATTVMTVGFRERERILAVIELITGLRMNNAYVRPGGVAQDTPPGAIDRIRDMVPAGAQGRPRAGEAPPGEPDPEGPHGRRRLPRPDRLHRPGHHRTGAALDRPAARPAQALALLRLRDLRVRRRDPRQLRRLRAAVRAAGGDPRVAADHRAGGRPAAGPGRPGDDRGQEDRLARPARHRRRRHGQQPRPHQGDHGHLHGVPDPSLQAGDRGLPGPARTGLHGGRVGQGRARRATWSATAAPAPTARTSATRRSTTCRPRPRCARAARSPTSSSPSPRSTP